MINFIKLTKICLEAHEAHNSFNKEGNIVAPDDPRYTPLIGVWNGYQAPEQRWQDWHSERKLLRRTMLEWLNNPNWSPEELEDHSNKYLSQLTSRNLSSHQGQSNDY